MVISLAKLSVLIRFTAGMNSDPLCQILSRSSIPFSPFPVARNFFDVFGFFMSSASLFVWLPSRASSICIASLNNNNCFGRYGGLPNYQRHLYQCMFSEFLLSMTHNDPCFIYLFWSYLILESKSIRRHKSCHPRCSRIILQPAPAFIFFSKPFLAVAGDRD